MSEKILFVATFQDERDNLMIRANRVTTTLAFFEPVIAWVKAPTGKDSNYEPKETMVPFVHGSPHYIQLRTELLVSNMVINNKGLAQIALEKLTHDVLQVVRQGWYEVIEHDAEYTVGLDGSEDTKYTNPRPKKVPVEGVVRVPSEYYLEWARKFSDNTWFLFSGGQIGKPFFDKDEWDWRLNI